MRGGVLTRARVESYSSFIDLSTLTVPGLLIFALHLAPVRAIGRRR